MRFFTITTALVALVAASPVDVEVRQSKPDPDTVYVESKS